MLLFLETVNIAGILLMIFILTVITKQQSSKAQTAFILYDLFTIIFVIGIQLELMHSDTVGEALSGLCVQYVGQAGLLMSLLWFVSEFTGFFIPIWVYRLEAICNTFVLVGVFTADKHRFFYASMKMLTDGMYNRIEVTGGILWRLHFIHLYLVVFTILVLCAVKYKGSTPMQKKRIAYIGVGIGAMAALLLVKIAGVFGSYNPIVIAMTFSMFCMMIAMIRYSYFNSLDAAVDNAFNHGNEGLIILDREDTVVFVNHRMDELFPDIRKGSIINQYQKIKEIIEGDEHLLRRGGVVYELRAENIIEHGERNGRMLWFVDQTQGLLTMQKLKEADEAKTQFLMKVSHELRTPMNTILGMNEMILRESSEGEIKRFAKEVEDAGAHMMSLIDEILDTSRLESGTLTVEKSPFRIIEALEKVEDLMRPQVEEKGLVFQVEVEEELKTEGMFQIGDTARLFQVIVNLLSNAVKYTDSGFVSLKAETQTVAGDRRMILSVSDSGIGIREEELTRIFENFERGSNTGGRDGIGLGLAIVKQLTEAMGGTLTVESALGKGSTFRVSFPWREASEEELAAWFLKNQEQEEMTEQEKNIPDFHTKTILAVDDNVYNLMVLKHLLKRTKAVVETAADGHSAVEACAKKRYDLILLDHMMPAPDGIATLHQIREDKDGKNRDTKVIALTANAEKGAEQMYLSEGFAGYITKPVDPRNLEQMLCRLLDVEEKAEFLEKETRTKSEWLEQLEQSGIQTQEGLRYADMDAAFYRELLTLFVRQQENQQQKLNKIYQDIEGAECKMSERDAFWDSWIAFCHGRKSEARGLGASRLGEYFYRLELLGRTKDIEKIKEIYPLANQEWKRAANEIQLAIKEP